MCIFEFLVTLLLLLLRCASSHEPYTTATGTATPSTTPPPPPPFFPVDLTPPPQLQPTNHTTTSSSNPADISSLDIPKTNSSSGTHHLLILTISAASASLLLASMAIYCCRSAQPPPNTHPHPKPFHKSSYHHNPTDGTLSPELRPLAPLTHHFAQPTPAADQDDDTFYSPRGSVGPRFSSPSTSPYVPNSYSSSDSSYSNSNSPDRSVSITISPHLTLSPNASIPKSPDPPSHAPDPLFNCIPNPPPPPPPPLPLMPSNPKNLKPVLRPPVLTAPSMPFMMRAPTNSSPSDLPAAETPERADEHASAMPKLKPLHWDKVKASSNREMVWDQLKTSSFKLNEEMIKTLFGCSSNPNEPYKRSVISFPIQEHRVLDPKKSQNIAILLRALNVTIDEVCEALLEGNADALGTELLECLLKMAPTKEEERRLKEYKDDSPFKLGPAEKFLKAVIDVPFAFKRLDAMLYIANFVSEGDYLKNSFETLEAACEELRDSRMFMKLLEAVLMTGNRMNVGTNRGDARAFKLDTLLKLVDVKGTDGKTTLLHFVVQEIIRSEGARIASGSCESMNEESRRRKLGLKLVSDISLEVANVKKAATMDSDVLGGDLMKLSKGISEISEVVRLVENVGERNGFSEWMRGFMKMAEEEVAKIHARERGALSRVKEITEYFHGNSALEEAHPFRIFMIVRDFLGVLDRVCKEVGMINERTVVNPKLTTTNTCRHDGIDVNDESSAD